MSKLQDSDLWRPRRLPLHRDQTARLQLEQCPMLGPGAEASLGGEPVGGRIKVLPRCRKFSYSMARKRSMHACDLSPNSFSSCGRVSLTNRSSDLGILAGRFGFVRLPGPRLFEPGRLLGGALHELAAHELVALGLVQHAYISAASGSAPISRSTPITVAHIFCATGRLSR